MDQHLLMKQQSINAAAIESKLKQQKTQLHPTLVSIVEEEETYSDEDPEGLGIGFNEEGNEMDQIDEEDDSSYDTISQYEEKEPTEDPPVVYEIITTKPNAEGPHQSVKEVYSVRSDAFRKTFSMQNSIKSQSKNP